MTTLLFIPMILGGWGGGYPISANRHSRHFFLSPLIVCVSLRSLVRRGPNRTEAHLLESLKSLTFALLFSLSLAFATVTPAHCQQAKPGSVLVERVGDTAFIQLHAPSFQALTPRQQALAYWLTQASIAIDPIF